MAVDVQTTPATRNCSGLLWTGRVISGLLTLMLLFGSVMNLAKTQQALAGGAKLGVSESAVTGIGVALLVSTLLYALPATAVLGAILLTGYLGGAVMAHVHMGDPAGNIAMPVVFGALVWLGLLLRDPRLRAVLPFRRAA
jgi:hypothetical protein